MPPYSNNLQLVHYIIAAVQCYFCFSNHVYSWSSRTNCMQFKTYTLQTIMDIHHQNIWFINVWISYHYNNSIFMHYYIYNSIFFYSQIIISFGFKNRIIIYKYQNFSSFIFSIRFRLEHRVFLYFYFVNVFHKYDY